MLAIILWYSLYKDTHSSQVAVRADSQRSDQSTESRSKERETKVGMDGGSGVDLKGLNYTIEGSPVQFRSGSHHGEDGNASIVASATGDLNGDNNDDLVVVLRLNSVGSGIFYYINAFLHEGPGKRVNVGEAFLGDRIQIEFLDIYEGGSVSVLTGVAIHPADYGQFVAGYHTHSQDQAFAEKPNLFVTRHWQVTDGRLVLIEDF